MEKKKTVAKTPAKKKPAETSKEKFAQLTNSIDAVASELEALKLNIQKEKNADTTRTDSVNAISSELKELKLIIQQGKNEDTTQAKSVEAISSELETLKINIQKRKSENTTLKILFYTGLIVLLLGFLYTNSTLQRAQMDSIETNINSLRTLMNQELLRFERNVYQKIDLLENEAGEQSKANLRESLENMTQAISQLDPADEKTAELIDQVKKNSTELSAVYSEQKSN